MNLRKINIKKWLKQGFIKRIVKNSGTLLTGSFGGSMIGLVSFAIIIRTLGTNVYGQFLIMQTYMETFNQLFNFQCWQAMINFGSKALEENDDNKFREIIKIGFLFDILSALLGTVLAVSLTSIIGGLMDWSEYQITVTRIFSFLILFNVTGTPIGVLRLLKKFKHISAHRLASAIFKLIVVSTAWILGISDHYFIYILIFIILIDQISIIFIAAFVLKKRGLLNFLSSKITEWKSFVKFALWTNIESTINLPKKKLNKFLIQKFLSYEAVAIYEVFGRFTLILRKVTNSIYYAIFPELSRKIASGQRKGAIKEGLKIGIILFAAGLPFYIIFAISMNWLLGPIFGTELVPYYWLLLLYVGYNYVTVLFTALDPLIISLGFVKSKVSINIVSNVVFMGIVILLQGRLELLGFMIADMMQITSLVIMKIAVIKKNEFKYEARNEN